MDFLYVKGQTTQPISGVVYVFHKLDNGYTEADVKTQSQSVYELIAHPCIHINDSQ